MATTLGIPETRDASGTSWQPDSTPMFMWHWMTGGWSLGLHTNVFAGYDSEALYQSLCAACHGARGEGRGDFPALVAGRGSVGTVSPVLTATASSRTHGLMSRLCGGHLGDRNAHARADVSLDDVGHAGCRQATPSCCAKNQT
jgi:hypothetical protein